MKNKKLLVLSGLLLVGCSVQSNTPMIAQPTILTDLPSEELISMTFADISIKSPIDILSNITNTPIVFDEFMTLRYISMYQIDEKPAIIFQRMLEASCLNYRKTDDNSIIIYGDKEQCEFKRLNDNELAKLPNFNQKISFNGELIYNLFDKPLKYPFKYHEYFLKIAQSTNTGIMAMGLNFREIRLKVDNQPAYKVLQTLATANCFDVAQLSDNSLLLVNKPENDRCQPVQTGIFLQVYS